MSYNFNKKVETHNYTVEVDTNAAYGCFEHHTLGDEQGGGLWFDLVGGTLALRDYDGVACLPKQVIEALRGLGFAVDPDFE